MMMMMMTMMMMKPKYDAIAFLCWGFLALTFDRLIPKAYRRLSIYGSVC